MSTPNVYLDHAATTPIDPRVYEVMLPYLTEKFGNPSSFHSVGKEVKDAMDLARQQMATILDVRPDELLFTSGGTESDNLAILGYARANQSVSGLGVCRVFFPDFLADIQPKRYAFVNLVFSKSHFANHPLSSVYS